MTAKALIRAIQIVPLHIAVLKAQTCTGRPLSYPHDVVGIGSCHLSGMPELTTVRRIGRSSIEVLNRMAGISTIDVFDTRLQLMAFSDRSEPICLEGMFRKTLSQVLQLARIVEWRILKVYITVFLFCTLTRQGEHIRESEKLALSTRLMLIVQSSVP